MALEGYPAKEAALRGFYERVIFITSEMGWMSHQEVEPRVMSAMHPVPQEELVPVLIITAPGGLQARFGPEYSLGTPGNALTVAAKCTHPGGGVTDKRFTLLPARTSSSDDEIRSFLRPDRPAPPSRF